MIEVGVVELGDRDGIYCVIRLAIKT